MLVAISLVGSKEVTLNPFKIKAGQGKPEQQ